MTERKFASAVRAALGHWLESTTPSQREADFLSPATLGASLALVVQQELVTSGHVPDEVRHSLLLKPSIHLEDLFDISSLVPTPTDFGPVPLTESTLVGQAAALAVHSALHMESVSYGTENAGMLFVNLVPLPGQGAFSEKSKKDMRGHTDGVSFPFNGDDDPNDERIAPSPDLVTLVGLRNPLHVPTKVIPVGDVLAQLSQDHIDQLMKPQYAISSQKTFRQGMKRMLGSELVSVDQPILRSANGSVYARYSHSNVVASVEGGVAEQASQAFEAACRQATQLIVIKPGDLLILNNRLALHGRGIVGETVGGTARWILRTYGLDTRDMPEHKRHLAERPRHILFP